MSGARVRVRVPASTANLGPGFDALGLALGLYDVVTAEVVAGSGEPPITVTGEGADAVPLDGSDSRQEVEQEAEPPPVMALPVSFAGGRYEVRGLLGEGGRKRVYEAYDIALRRKVALATVKTEGLD